MDAWLTRLEDGLDHLIHCSHVATPDQLSAMVAESAAMFGAGDATIFLADLQQRVLVPFDPEAGGGLHDRTPLKIDATLAGRAFQQMQRLSQSGTTPESDRAQVWLPLIDGVERVGVLGMTLPSTALADEAGMARLQRFASVTAELVVTKTAYGDSIVRVRRTQPMTLAAEVQWSLLPPLTFANHAVTVAGGLEPAYEVAGDSLDYAVDVGTAKFAVFDGMGHGIVSAQLISLVIAAYRNARRSGQSLVDTASHIEQAVNEVFRVESFATGLLCELDTANGVLTTLSAGHYAPLLLRDGRLVRELAIEPLLPLGLHSELGRSHDAAVTVEQLQPGDLLLLYTDGVVEARSPDGAFFGQERLVDLVTRNLAADLPAPETLRRVIHALLEHQAGHLDDDATLLLVEWHGPRGADGTPPPLSETGRRALDPGRQEG
ncbi:serine/threonine protein phosphatase PrpC [Nocardioides massiliensis]|uniref:Serine/threonine protein phosphatase PrpC n=2 Tax=Nocardioides massiliensis TaxID=1325935 RepID=A0ABT9NIU3_9ACTN|nr:PP2C family protein-serine/threonine phosphatase [Nocardioides massiliensis]MDP9820331.1 serine/threonine protein phosphatase PrpC [Nocardioides massiliensis]